MPRLGYGYGSGMGGGGAAAAAVLSTANLHSDHDADYGVTLSPTMWPYGGATPVPTLSGNLASGEFVYIRCRQGGAGGLAVAIFYISLDGGKTIHYYGTVPGGTYTSPLGLIITFPAADYTSTATYVSRAASWLDRTNTWTFAQDGAVACPITAGWGFLNGGFTGLPAVTSGARRSPATATATCSRPRRGRPRSAAAPLTPSTLIVSQSST